MSKAWTLAGKYAYIPYIVKLVNQDKRFEALKEIRECLDEARELEDKDKTHKDSWAEGYLSGIELCLTELVGVQNE